MTTVIEDPIFVGWPKIARLFRECVITEKIDGTNAAVGILEDGRIYAQSRKRIITPDSDNFGFATWVAENAGTLLDDLGPGLHFGEWWGRGIQRGYGLDERRFSLFNTTRWSDAEFYTPNLSMVPVLYSGQFSTFAVEEAIHDLVMEGSAAAIGWGNPEGVVVYHVAANQSFKVTIENDEAPKGVAA